MVHAFAQYHSAFQTSDEKAAPICTSTHQHLSLISSFDRDPSCIVVSLVYIHIYIYAAARTRRLFQWSVDAFHLAITGWEWTPHRAQASHGMWTRQKYSPVWPTQVGKTVACDLLYPAILLSDVVAVARYQGGRVRFPLSVGRARVFLTAVGR